MFCNFWPNEVKNDYVLSNSIQDFRSSKFQLKVILNRLSYFLLNFRIIHIRSNIWLSNAHLISSVYPKVTREDDDAFREIDRVALTICHPAIFKYLQKLIKDGRMCFFNLIEKQYRERILSHRISKLTTCLISNISRRRTKKLLIAMALAILAHIKTDAAAFIAEEFFSKRLRSLRFTGSCRASKEEYTLWLCMRRALKTSHTGDSTLDNI